LLLLSGLALAGVEHRSQRRLAAHAEAERALEASYEQIRAGALPFAPGVLDVPFAAEGGTLELALEPTDTPSLYRIRITAKYRTEGVDRRRALEGLLWRP